MSSSATPQDVRASGRRLTPPRFEELELPSTFESLTPLRQYTSASVIEETENGNDYLDVFAEVTDADEVFAEQWESGATEQSTTPLLKRIDSFDFFAGGVNEPSSIAKTRTMSTITTLEPVKEDTQPACASFCRAPAYVELLFDAETPYASDEDLANRSMFTTGSFPEIATYPLIHHQERLLAPDLLDTSDLKLQPSLAVPELHDDGSLALDSDASPIFPEDRSTIPELTCRRSGRSLTQLSGSATTGITATEERWQLEHDPVLRYATSRSFLPGRDSLCNITTCSLAVEYDRDIEDLYRATTCFLGDCHDGECTCLDNKRGTRCVPGEDFVLADKYDDFNLSLRYPTAKDIFELIDELVDVDMFDMEDGFGNSAEEPQAFPDTSLTTSLDTDAFVACGPLLYSPTFDDVSNVCDSDNVSETSETNDKPGLSPPRYPEIAYVDAETHKCVAYTALNQLLSMQEDRPRPVIHRDIPEDEDYDSAELKEHSYLNLEDQGRKSRPSLRDDPCPSRFWSDFTSGIGHPPAPPQTSLQRQSAVRQQCLPFGLYSSNLPHHQRRFPQLTLATQLVPASEPLSTVDEEQLSWPSPSSSGDSIGFADYQGFAKPLEERQQGFSNDADEERGTYVEHGLEAPVMPSSPPLLTCEDMFTDVVWDSAPDLTLTQPHCEPHAAATITSRIPSAPLLEAFETEVHNRLTFIFSCMNDGRYDELPVLCNDLHWTLCALAHDYPAMAVLDSLGAAVEILAERIIASTPAS
ncbi:uncharacterized protein J4E92_006646 [Alternaria infectoria]|uniref:uncharacterized protein n=1 Tax=Alternaria infectoria TaxID=45303 RepID=UPI00221FC8F6|nr:uncharacterized protein J4E92_006646 [Alternaria infectoria]KAI4925910.1 hypothetical protein J4E92_006646 [Alternaria infectoria]